MFRYFDLGEFIGDVLVLGAKTAFQVIVGIATAILGAIATFLVLSSVGLTEAPPTAIFEVPHIIEEGFYWLSRAARAYCMREGC
jgi:hypothetical protein